MTYVCLCADKTESEVRTLIQSGMTDVDTLVEESGICGGCSTCSEAVEEILNDELSS